MRSSAALVYNCKQARIVLAGTSFATTGALAPQRSAERKVRLRTGGGSLKEYTPSNSSLFNLSSLRVCNAKA